MSSAATCKRVMRMRDPDSIDSSAAQHISGTTHGPMGPCHDLAVCLRAQERRALGRTQLSIRI